MAGRACPATGDTNCSSIMLNTAAAALAMGLPPPPKIVDPRLILFPAAFCTGSSGPPAISAGDLRLFRTPQRTTWAGRVEYSFWKYRAHHHIVLERHVAGKRHERTFRHSRQHLE